MGSDGVSQKFKVNIQEGLSVILPIYNEETNVQKVAYALISYMRAHLKDFEIIAVDDGSQDTTLGKLKDIKKLNPELRIITYKENRGYGFAIRNGIESASREWTFIMDSDGQFDINDFDLLWENRRFYSFVLGYREQRKDNLYRIILANLGHSVSNLLLTEKMKDINCGFKLFRTEDLKSIPLVSNGGSIYFEVLFHLLKSARNSNFLQVPVNHYKRMKGKQTGGTFRVILRNIMGGMRIVFFK